MSSIVHKNLNMRKFVSSDEDSEIEVVSELKVNLTKHQCDLCCKGSFLVSKLLQFGGVLTEECKFICDICDEGFKLKTDLTKHKSTHRAEDVKENGKLSENPPSATPFLCQHCENSYKYEKSLNRHVLKKHSTQSKYTCAVCKEIFTNFNKFKVHCVKHEQGGSELHICHYCGKKFIWKNTLVGHIKIHDSNATLS